MYGLKSFLVLSTIFGMVYSVNGCQPGRDSNEILVQSPIPNNSTSQENKEKAIFDLSPDLLIATRETPTGYLISQAGQASGFEFELASEFAKSIGKRPVFVVFPTLEEIKQALDRGQVHFSAASIDQHSARSYGFRFGPSYHGVRIEIICHRSQVVNALVDLIDRKLAVAREDSYAVLLQDLKWKIPALQWEMIEGQAHHKLLKMINHHEIDCGLVSSDLFQLKQHQYPNLRVRFEIGEAFLAWPISPKYQFLMKEIESWQEQDTTRNFIQQLVEKFYGFANHFDYYDIHIFKQRIESRLPIYEGLLRKAVKDTGLPFSLLAAVSYQESHWDPLSVSPTGVQGFMMLTNPTAAFMGVTDRLDAGQSILAGAKYLKMMIEQLPTFINKEDRLWMGLASYNIGYYHMQDARRLAIEFNKNPNSWRDLKEVLPYLADAKYLHKLKHGYARGHEPVTYVRKIRRYRQILTSNLNIEPETSP